MNDEKLKATLDRFFKKPNSSSLSFNDLLKNTERKFVACLDAGGGYSDCGAGLNGYYAYTPNAQIIYKLANILVRTKKFEVFVTHPLTYADESLSFDSKLNSSHKYIHTVLNDISPDPGKKIVGYENYSKKYTSKDKRSAIEHVIEKFKNQKSYKVISLCVQHNAVPENLKDSDVAGMELYYDETSQFSNESLKLCQTIFQNCKNIYGTEQRKNPIKAGNFVINKVSCPSALIEVEFIDNLRKQKIISDDKKQTEMAEGIKKAILEFFNIK